MKLSKFTSNKGLKAALSNMPDGSNLPKIDAPWKCIGSTNFETSDPARVGFSYKEISDAITSKGFIVWPAKDS
jgi:hypothetical protein